MESEKLVPKIEEKETKEKEPEIKLKFFFSPHFKKEDFAKLRKEIENCDVYMPELADYNPETLDAFRKISLGDLSPEEFAWQYKRKGFSLYHRIISEALYNSKKLIYLVDIPRGHELMSGFHKALTIGNRSFIEFLSGNFSNALTEKKNYIEFFHKLEKEREEYIKENIEKLKNQIFQDHPNLKNKEEINFLVSLGALHTPLFHQFRKEGKIPTQQRFASLPMIYPAEAELGRKKIFFPEKEMNNDKLAQSFIEEITLLALEEDKNIQNSIELTKVTKYMAAGLKKEEDVKKFSEMLSKKYSCKILTSLILAPIVEPEWRELFEPPLEEFGIKLPKTREEVEEIIKKVEKGGY